MSTLSSIDYSESLIVHFRRAELLRDEAVGLVSLDLNSRQLCDLELLLHRGFYPLSGYLNQDDYLQVLETMRLADGTVWPMPICLDVNVDVAASLQPGQRVALNDQEGFLLAILTVGEVWHPDREHEAEAVYGTTNPDLHPGVKNLYQKTAEWYVGGQVEGVSLPIHYDFRNLRLTPAETHRRFTQYGWRRVLGFHTREYLHCAHREMVLAAAREINASIFIHPAAGLDHPGNRDHYTLVQCYQEFITHFPANMILLGIVSLADRFAGPREALWHAMIRKNFGCSHFMVAKDHGDPFAGSDQPLFYPQGAAQQLVARMAGETGIAMVPERAMGYVEEKAQYVFLENVGEHESVKTITSQELKRRLEWGLEIPEWYSYQNVIQALRRAFPPRSRQGFTVFLTGLSGSGKSTIAKVLMVRFMEMGNRPVTLLDGDIVRKNLSSELNFSEAHRNLNVTRIGFVASEITKNGGIALCAPIAPYEASRAANRELISRYGGYIEVYVSTPLEVCEQRDRKGLYAKARKGLVKGVTGISDPYVPPVNPELTIDTSTMTPAEAVQEILLYLEEQGYIS
ncbi:sulfate adenylyltransferase; adenylylsulfate kinase [Desulfobulbus propionicus DSM 2032]|uniref:adenylyl-sulfate kinase n=1 Tax=Desulfobulbus propionicus (strain ATCC 33891 / DSM 2032 / VKM B-1956 / 1pr3) TaxID=577650 RepID=A0A7U3YJI2_DESPD|nr:bifunctional sulfate adenylyltransferase/adenylylsulfate kinase [Desulfobulbus propionicus]ADW16545.1 sulfate adenylyltransferase; adenylylsulfate kinase [Desulfobulbus propionicus DSM 2032]